MNGYNEGYYNTVVTQLAPDDLSKYLANNEVVYDKKIMNGKYQVGSGRIVTFTHETPFINNTIPQPNKIVNTQMSLTSDISPLQSQYANADSDFFLLYWCVQMAYLFFCKCPIKNEKEQG